MKSAKWLSAVDERILIEDMKLNYKGDCLTVPYFVAVLELSSRPMFFFFRGQSGCVV